MNGTIVMTVLVLALSVAATATAQIIPVGHIQQANFPPCGPGSPPLIGSCTDTAPKVVATCNPAGISTISTTKSGNGWNFLQGTFTETVTATIGPQTGPEQPEIAVIGGIRNGSAGFPTGRLLSFDSTFTFQSYDGRTTITGTKSLVDDLQNVGVCRTYNNELSHSTRLGSALVTGFFYLANAQVLNYAGTMTTDGVAQAVAGPAETYLANSFATCCGGDTVNASSGHLATSFGTTHPALGSTWWTNTPVGLDVTVRPAPGVTINFDAVSAPGNTTVVVVGTGDVPPLPNDGSFLVGDPPALYEISTAATYTPPVQICVPYGGPAPAGYVPTLLHYEGSSWTDVATSYDELLRIVCGEVTSFSPFAAGYKPATPPPPPPPPTPLTKDACKNDGWRTFESLGFRNQGQCVSWVATGGRRPGR